MELSTSETLLTCRKFVRRCPEFRDEVGGCLFTGRSATGGQNVIWSSVRNVGTCRYDAKGDSQAEVPRATENHGGGSACSCAEGSVMELEGRGRLGRWKGRGTRRRREGLAHETRPWLRAAEWTEKSRLRRESHVRIYGGMRVQFPRATQIPVQRQAGPEVWCKPPFICMPNRNNRNTR